MPKRSFSFNWHLYCEHTHAQQTTAIPGPQIYECEEFKKRSNSL